MWEWLSFYKLFPSPKVLKNISQIMIYEIVFFCFKWLIGLGEGRFFLSEWFDIPSPFVTQPYLKGSLLEKNRIYTTLYVKMRLHNWPWGRVVGDLWIIFFFFLRKKMISLPVPYIVVLPYFQEPWFKVNWIYNTLGIFSTVVICCLRWKIFKNANTFSVIPYQIPILLRYKYPNILHYTS